MKLLFFNLNKSINCTTFYNTPKKENVILKINESDSGYCTMLRNPNNKDIHFYYRKTGSGKSVHHSDTCLSISKDGINFNPPNKIFSNKCVSHNFSPFYDTKDKIFKGVGGLHITKWKGHFRLCKKYGNCEKTTELLSYPQNKKGGGKIFDASKEHQCYGGGLYLLTSNDGVKWELDSNKSFINGLHNGQTDGLFNCSEFDGGITCFYDESIKKYSLYCRSNVITQHRYIQYTSSPDMKNWDDFDLITTTPKRLKKDNYYYSGFTKYPDTNHYIGITPYSDNTKENSGIWLMLSEDGKQWGRKQRWIATSCKSNRTSQHSVTGVILSNDEKEMYFYIQDNYFKLNGNKPINIVRYSIKIDRLFGITPTDKDKEAEFTIQFKHKNKSMFYINMETEERGHISIKLLDKNMKKINKSNKIVGNDINYKVEWRTNRFHFEYLLIVLYKASVYSINYT